MKAMIIRAMTIIMVAAGLVTCTSTTSVATNTTADADWILSAQLPSGAIAIYTDKLYINPYFANFAAQGLAVAHTETGDARYSTAAWQWLEWYTAHQDANGYVTDYNVNNGVETSTGNMDSTDSYAGTFLITAKALYKATRNKPKLQGIHVGLTAAVNAIESTQQADGMTWAKPSWPLKYLMDQAEVYSGLKAAVTLANVLGDTALATRASNDAVRMYDGVQTLWNPVTDSYDWVKFNNGVKQSTNWDVLYPDAAQQPWAVMFGLVPHARAADLMDTFDIRQPNWDQPQSGYWAPIGMAYLKVGDKDRAQSAYTSIHSTAMSNNRAWPYNTATAGQLLLLNHG